MTTEQQGQGAPPPQNVAALVDAIDARARQAGTEGATDVLQRMLGSVTDVLEGIQDRLESLEDAVSATQEAGGGGGVADAVQAGLAAFNARLGRLEEAFVQAVDESGSGTQAVVEEVRVVVTRALEESRPATSEPEVAQGLAPSLRMRLDELEHRFMDALRQQTPPAPPIDLTSFHDRLDASEARIASAAEEASRDAVNSWLAPVLDRIDAVDRRIQEAPRALQANIEAAFEVVQARIATLEQLVRTKASDRIDPSAAVRAAVAPVAERLSEIDASQRSTTAKQNEAIGRVEAALGAMPGRLASLEERVAAVASSITEAAAASSTVDTALLIRLEEAVERLQRDESSARLVKLVEERLSAGLRAVTERTDEVRRALDQLARSAASAAASAAERSDDGALDDVVASLRALQAATHEVPDEVANSIGSRLAPLGDRITGLDGRLDGLAERLADLAEALAELAARPAPEPPAFPELPTPPDHGAAIAELRTSIEVVGRQLADLAGRPVPDPPAAPDLGALAEQLTGAVRREAELLTQRVAALAVGVEASRVLLEQQLQETEHSIGRKAGEVTRRLAADFGIRTRRSGPGGRRDPRELGSG